MLLFSLTRISSARYPHLARVARSWFWAIPVVAAFSILIGLMEGLGVGLLIPLLSTLGQSSSGPINNPVLAVLERFARHAGFQDRLIIITGTVLMVMIVKNVLSAVSNSFSASLYGRIGQDIRVALVHRLQRAPYGFFLGVDAARLMNILGTESWQAVDAIKASFVRVGSTSVVVVIGWLLVIIDWRLSILVAVGALGTRAMQKSFERRVQDMSRRMTAANDILAARMLFSIFGARVIRLFHQQAAEERRFIAASDNVRRELLAIDKLSGILWPSLETLHIFLFMIVLVVAVLVGIELPVLAAFLVLLNRMQPHLRTLEQATGTYAATSGQLREIEWLLDPAQTSEGVQGQHSFERLTSGITFDRVTFEYQAGGERPPALVDLSFDIPRGSRFALIGRSGAGKSTLINLLTGLLQPTHGSIRVDGVDLVHLRRDHWLGALAVAGQDIDLFDGTIAENIAFGAPDADESAILAAARNANAEFIEGLPEGLHTHVGERGIALSGGQRQRIGIARALIRRPQILILDEATNAIDRQSENAIIETLKSLDADTTVVLISHRAETLRLCTHAVVIEEGLLVKKGTIANPDEGHDFPAIFNEQL